jgi:hypothetical protein
MHRRDARQFVMIFWNASLIDRMPALDPWSFGHSAGGRCAMSKSNATRCGEVTPDSGYNESGTATVMKYARGNFSNHGVGMARVSDRQDP